MSPISALSSKTIQFLRFPLIMGVIFIHTNFLGICLQGVHLVTPQTFPIYTGVSYAFEVMCLSVCVPLFAVIAGYLFFTGQDFNQQTYLQKLKSRAKTLLIPYIFWNLLEWGLLILSNTLLTPLTSGRNAHALDMDIWQWFSIFWEYRGYFPINIQFWYIRDLMVTVLISPVLYWAIKKWKLLFMALLSIVWLVDVKLPILGIYVTIPFFFSIGAYFSIWKKDISQTTLLWLKPISIAYALLWVVFIVLCQLYDTDTLEWFKRVVPIVSVFALLAWTSYYMQKKQVTWPHWINNSVFFLYGYHCIVMALCLKLWIKYIPLLEVNLLIGYVVMPFFVAALGVGICCAAKKIAPRFMALITGGR